LLPTARARDQQQLRANMGIAQRVHRSSRSTFWRCAALLGSSLVLNLKMNYWARQTELTSYRNNKTRGKNEPQPCTFHQLQQAFTKKSWRKALPSHRQSNDGKITFNSQSWSLLEDEILRIPVSAISNHDNLEPLIGSGCHLGDVYYKAILKLPLPSSSIHCSVALQADLCDSGSAMRSREYDEQCPHDCLDGISLENKIFSTDRTSIVASYYTNAVVHLAQQKKSDENFGLWPTWAIVVQDDTKLPGIGEVGDVFGAVLPLWNFSYFHTWNGRKCVMSSTAVAKLMLPALHGLTFLTADLKLPIEEEALTVKNVGVTVSDNPQAFLLGESLIMAPKDMTHDNTSCRFCGEGRGTNQTEQNHNDSATFVAFRRVIMHVLYLCSEKVGADMLVNALKSSGSTTELATILRDYTDTTSFRSDLPMSQDLSKTSSLPYMYE